MNRNAFLVRLISDAQIYPRDLLMELCLEYQIMNRLIRRIGTNVNQLAKVANATKNTPAAHFLMDMHQEIQTMKKNLQPLWEEARRITWQS
jgi:ferritin